MDSVKAFTHTIDAHAALLMHFAIYLALHRENNSKKGCSADI